MFGKFMVDNVNTVGIGITDPLGFQMVEISLIIEWSVIQAMT